MKQRDLNFPNLDNRNHHHFLSEPNLESLWWTIKIHRSHRLFKLSNSSSVTWPPNTTLLIPSDGYKSITKRLISYWIKFFLRKWKGIKERNWKWKLPGGAEWSEKQSQRRENQEAESRTTWADLQWKCVVS